MAWQLEVSLVTGIVFLGGDCQAARCEADPITIRHLKAADSGQYCRVVQSVGKVVGRVVGVGSNVLPLLWFNPSAYTVVSHRDPGTGAWAGARAWACWLDDLKGKGVPSCASPIFCLPPSKYKRALERVTRHKVSVC